MIVEKKLELVKLLVESIEIPKKPILRYGTMTLPEDRSRIQSELPGDCCKRYPTNCRKTEDFKKVLFFTKLLKYHLTLYDYIRIILL